MILERNSERLRHDINVRLTPSSANFYRTNLVRLNQSLEQIKRQIGKSYELDDTTNLHVLQQSKLELEFEQKTLAETKNSFNKELMNLTALCMSSKHRTNSIADKPKGSIDDLISFTISHYASLEKELLSLPKVY